MLRRSTGYRFAASFALIGLALASGVACSSDQDENSGVNRSWPNGIERAPVPEDGDEGFVDANVRDYRESGVYPRARAHVSYVADSTDPVVMQNLAKACIQHYLPDFPGVDCRVYPTQADFEVLPPGAEEIPVEDLLRPCFSVFGYIPPSGGDYNFVPFDGTGPLPPECPSAG